MPTDRFSHRLLSHLADRRYQPTKLQELARDLGVPEGELQDFVRSVDRLVDDGQVVLGSSETVVLPPPGRDMTGVFRLHERGFGFLISDRAVGHGDLFIPAGQTGGAMTGDRVKAQVIHEPRRAGPGGASGGAARSPYVGRIVEIIQRAEKRYTGNLCKIGSQWVAEIDGRMLRDPVIIRDPTAKNAKAGDKVVVELIEYPRQDRPAQGVITEVLGEQGEPDVETQAVVRAYGLREHFPATVTEEARNAALSFDEHRVPPEREDLTNEFIITIDPPDAKDFDDAISIRRLEPSPHGRGWPASGGPGEGANERLRRPETPSPGGVNAATLSQGERGIAAWELGVHIADVSHFVRKGSALDREAYVRGNSTYLPRRVVPMLPEVLSNGVCSLQEKVNRYCLSAFIRYDAAGNVLSQRFARSVIRSAKRLTYLEAQALIDGQLREAIKHAATEPKYPRQLIETLRLMNELAKVIRQRRLGDGMIVLGLPEVELIFDDSGRVIDARPEDDAFTHTVIEMLMVEANEATARLFDNLNVPMIRRIHPDPPSHDINELRQFARIAGYHIPTHPDRKALQGLLDSVRGKPAQAAVHLAVLQTLAKAEYSPALIGHFALASEHYTHFTSPIRRYPDLVVHRGIGAYLDARGASRLSGMAPNTQIARTLRDDPRLPDEQALVELGRHCSTTERNSEAAERDLRTYLVLDLLREHLGDDFDGTVTGVIGEGLFVQLDKYLVDGFVRINDLPGQLSDRWRLNRTTGTLVAERSGLTIQIGDRFLVRVAKVNPIRRQMELVIVSQYGKAPKERKRNQPPGARKAHELAMRLKQQRKRERRRG